MIHELRLVVTADDYDEAVAFYRDVLGMRQLEFWTSPDGGQVVLLDAGRATLEISDPTNSAWVDEVEVGRRVGAHIRVALEVDDSRAMTTAAVEAGAELRRGADRDALAVAELAARGARRPAADALRGAREEADRLELANSIYSRFTGV